MILRKLNLSRQARSQLVALATFILMTFLGVGWIQYQQIQRLSASASEGYENFLWDFFQLELNLQHYQTALRESLLQPENDALLKDTSFHYEIFAAQADLLKRGRNFGVMRDRETFNLASQLTYAHLEMADGLFLDGQAGRISQADLKGLFDHAQPLQELLHKLSLDALDVQAFRSTRALTDIRSFAVYGALTTTALLLLTAGFGALGIRQLILAGRRQKELETLHLDATHRAAHDPLTNLVNRFEFEKHLARALDLSHSHAVSHAVMFVDLDRFKIVNDTCGHSAGDQLLREVVRVIAACVRSTDVFARLGGDEFGVILTYCSPLKASHVAEKIRRAVDEFRFEYEGRRFHISASIGWVHVHQSWSSTEAVMQAADSACYLAKNSGRNRVHVYDENENSLRLKKEGTLWAQRIEEALDGNRFELYWQQLVPIQPGPSQLRGIRGEVLLRMVDPDGQLVSPGVFVPIAERFFLASRMDRWVLRAVFEWMIRHQNQLHHLDCLSINLSGQSVGDVAFHAEVMALMKNMPVDARKICFEVTETAAITNLEESVTFFTALRGLGARISLDDFGSGMSSFAYLKTLPAETLKIDGKFVLGLMSDPVDQVSVRCMAQLAQATRIETVAEWVETAEVENLLREYGVDYAQGYLHHRPEPINSLLTRCEALGRAVSAQVA